MNTIDSTWEQQFVLALRTRDISGAAIGAALAEVQAHCADTGESPKEAFGPPSRYAESLAFPARATVPGMPGSRTIALGATALAGLWLFPDAAGAVLRDERLAITWGWLAGIVCMTSVLAVAAASVRLAARRPWLAWVVMSLFIAAVVAPVVLWREVAFTTDALIPAVIAAALLAIGTAGLLRNRDRELDDRLVDPVTGEKESLPPAITWISRYSVLAFPVFAVALAIMDWASGGR